ncbi:MAG: carbamoyl-phosphate synthase large subunit, partial [Clostridia bacterium]|nr:carbamoyl-phosphate synthase large subunit [Clostridia bacterium]
STGEVLGLSTDFNEALLKGLIASGMNANRDGGVLITVANQNKAEVVPIAKKLVELGYRLYATAGTAKTLTENGLDVKVVGKLHDCDDIMDLIKTREVRTIINTPTKGRHSDRAGFKIRRLAVEQGANCFTSLDTVNAFVSAMSLGKVDKDLNVISLQEVDVINERN